MHFYDDIVIIKIKFPMQSNRRGPIFALYEYYELLTVSHDEMSMNSLIGHIQRI